MIGGRAWKRREASESRSGGRVGIACSPSACPIHWWRSAEIRSNVGIRQYRSITKSPWLIRLWISECSSREIGFLRRMRWSCQCSAGLGRKHLVSPDPFASCFNGDPCSNLFQSVPICSNGELDSMDILVSTEAFGSSPPLGLFARHTQEESETHRCGSRKEQRSITSSVRRIPEEHSPPPW
jgi:hypothetical protein